MIDLRIDSFVRQINQNMSYKHKTSANASERPKSSILPPLVPKSQTSDDQNRKRSSSFDNSFANIGEQSVDMSEAIINAEEASGSGLQEEVRVDRNQVCHSFGVFIAPLSIIPYTIPKNVKLSYFIE